MDLRILSHLQDLTFLSIKMVTPGGADALGRYSLAALTRLVKLETLEFPAEQESFFFVEAVVRHPKLRRLTIDSASFVLHSISVRPAARRGFSELHSRLMQASIS